MRIFKRSPSYKLLSLPTYRRISSTLPASSPPPQSFFQVRCPLSNLSNETDSRVAGRMSIAAEASLHSDRRLLLLTLLENEVGRIRLWLNPLLDAAKGPLPSNPTTSDVRALFSVTTARLTNGCRLLSAKSLESLGRLTRPSLFIFRNDSRSLHSPPRSLDLFVPIRSGLRTSPKRWLSSSANRFRARFDISFPFVFRFCWPMHADAIIQTLLFWAPVPVITALRFLFPKFGSNPILLQYALRVLEHHPVEVTFFYIPQVVQALRTDALGYAERFIFETSKISQLFCHQIIWNMKANAYRGDAGEEVSVVLAGGDEVLIRLRRLIR